MHCVRTITPDEGITTLAQHLEHELVEGKSVLWLFSGGSNIMIAVQIMQQLTSVDTSRLTIMPLDERFGPIGHADSNLAQLLDAGFDPQTATILSILVEGLDLAATTEHYRQQLEQAMVDHDVLIAQIGIGDDGHVAGILPHSEAADEQTKLVISYETPTYTRLTPTFPALLKITGSYTFAFGASKHDALTKLVNTDCSLTDQPAQILKQMSNVYIYNDQVGEPI